MDILGADERPFFSEGIRFIHNKLDSHVTNFESSSTEQAIEIIESGQR